MISMYQINEVVAGCVDGLCTCSKNISRLASRNKTTMSRTALDVESFAVFTSFARTNVGRLIYITCFMQTYLLRPSNAGTVIIPSSRLVIQALDGGIISMDFIIRDQQQFLMLISLLRCSSVTRVDAPRPSIMDSWIDLSFFMQKYLHRPVKTRTVTCLDLVLVDQPLDGSISSTNFTVIRPPSSPLTHPFSTNMTIVSNDPTWWPSINAYSVLSYFSVAATVGVTYDWALTLGQEIELVWRQRWSLMTVLYLSVRYLGILSAVLAIPNDVPTISLTDKVSWIMYVVWNWTLVLVFAMLWVIIITQLHAMYQRSRRMLVFLVVTFLANNIFDGVLVAIAMMNSSGEELVLSGTYRCSISHAEDIRLLDSVAWILSVVWEVLALYLAVWIAIKHFRELRQHSTGGIMGDCLMVLIKTHMLYFASSGVVSFFQLIIKFSPTLSTDNSLEAQAVYGLLQILQAVQMFVLGPRLILSIREYNARIVTDSDAATAMTSIAFQERVHISTGSSV
ncbi:uncharacterized protein EDB93DRAFT_1330290 [Suillus bovinus]|uniref:uncharacterized protein n=1 Tax=Suillus bovinus TaxID=48563 RepID=UPI001B85C333|nr:uncharacterized protein EDB93DRAFT_1330290 [Suillus bovinus]KAG2139178.1 hypothetical protein EDB93DRAFT_1330290 [Suillus bovinus]